MNGTPRRQAGAESRLRQSAQDHASEGKAVASLAGVDATEKQRGEWVYPQISLIKGKLIAHVPIQKQLPIITAAR
jgi:hypothetical protein